MTSRKRSRFSGAEQSRQESANGSGIVNVFQNDGSFLEMFKKMQNASQNEPSRTVTAAVVKPEEVESNDKEVIQPSPMPASTSAPPPPAFFGRRRYTKLLPVGKVKKLKTDDEEKKPATTDAWAKYLEEVKKYKETYCDSEAKNRSLVK